MNSWTPYISFQLSGQPMPAARARGTSSGHHYTPANYRHWKDITALTLKSKYRELVDLVPRVGDKSRAKWIKQNRFALTAQFWLDRNVGDLDNYLKAVIDAIQDSGIIANDKQIVAYHECRMEVNRTRPGTEVTLYKLEARE